MTKKNLDQSKMMETVNSNKGMSYAKMKTLLNVMYGLDLHDAKKGNFRFPVYISDRLQDVVIENLELSVRSVNCLRRAGFKTLYDLYDKINCKEDLKKIRCCGDGSAQEIMEQIFMYQYNSLKPERREKFIKRVVELNSEVED